MLDDLATRCGHEELYRRCRQFLAHHPVMRQEDRDPRRGWRPAVWSRVKSLYEPLPEYLKVDGLALQCPACDLPALPSSRKAPAPGQLLSGPDTWCEGEHCPHGLPLELVRAPEQVLLLRRPLRAFLTLPRAVEAAALDALREAEMDFEPLPGGLGAYRLTNSHENCVIRVYDRVQPALLAARYASEAAPSTDRTLVVGPERLAGFPGYRSAFISALPDFLSDRTVLTTPSALVNHLSDS